MESADEAAEEHGALETLLAAEEEYIVALRRITASIGRATSRHVGRRMSQIVSGRARSDAAALRLDSEPAPGFRTRLRRALARVREDVRREWPDDEVRAVLSDQADAVERAGSRTWDLSVSESSGIPVSDLRESAEALDRGGDDAEALSAQQRAAASTLAEGREVPLGAWRRRWTGENRRLTRSLLSEHLAKLGDELINAVAAGVGIVVLRNMTAERSAITSRRGDLIAQDQTQKGVGAQQQIRASRAGAGSYQWRTQGDDRVRPEHAAREGQTFRWSDPPSDGHPGEPVNCRCWAVPVIDG